MKKFGIIILIIVICVVAVIVVNFDKIFNKEENNKVNKNEVVSESENENVSEEDETAIKEYLGKILNTGVEIVEFDDINEADKAWLYAPLNECIERPEYDYYVNEEEITRTLNQLYGDDLMYDARSDTDSIDSMFVPKYDEERDEYEFSAFGIEVFSQYLINSIEKVDDKYVVNVTEYTINIFGGNEDDPGSAISVGKLDVSGNLEEIFTIPSTEVTELSYNHPDPVVEEEVSYSTEMFNSYDITLEKDEDDGSFYIKSADKVN